MKKLSLFLFGMFVVMIVSCTPEEIVTKNNNPSKKINVKEQYSEEVDPATIKPPTHG